LYQDRGVKPLQLAVDEEAHAMAELNTVYFFSLNLYAEEKTL
jgi:hypothetical protein